MNVIRRESSIQPVLYATNSKFYIAARYGRKDEAFEIAQHLEMRGHKVTSTWVRQVEDEMLYTEGPDAAGLFAQKDLEEIKLADMLVYLSEDEKNEWGRGGRHVEFGYALGLGKLVGIVGPLENLFHYLPYVVHFPTVDDFFSYLTEDSTR
jgi:hypothetical protein